MDSGLLTDDVCNPRGWIRASAKSTSEMGMEGGISPLKGRDSGNDLRVKPYDDKIFAGKFSFHNHARCDVGIRRTRAADYSRAPSGLSRVSHVRVA